MYQHLAGTRAKPWDNRELDVMDGGKFWSFLLTTVSQTAFFLFYTFLNDLFQIFLMMRISAVSTFIASNLALEGFIFFSVFFTAYRCFQIMDAKGGYLSPIDILKIYARKFIRLAPPYYICWLILWAIQARIGEGPVWYFTNITFDKCSAPEGSSGPSTGMLLSIFWANNLQLQLDPYAGCYQ